MQRNESGRDSGLVAFVGLSLDRVSQLEHVR